MKRQTESRFKDGETYSEIFHGMSEGNPGALTTLCRLVTADHTLALRDLDELEIYGPDIWIAFKYLCGGDVEKLAERLAWQDPTLKEEIAKIKSRDQRPK